MMQDLLAGGSLPLKKKNDGDEDEEEEEDDDEEEQDDANPDGSNEYIDSDEDDDSADASTSSMRNGKKSRERITIIGTGWAGYTLATSLDEHKFAITVISPSRALVYTPLLPSVATGAFPSSHLAEEPIRGKKRGRIRYLNATVEAVDFVRRRLRCKATTSGGDGDEVFDEPFARLAICAGCTSHLLGAPDGIGQHAVFVRTLDDARRLRRRLLEQLEHASLPTLTDDVRRQRLRVLIVGAGPVALELCGQLRTLAQSAGLRRAYPDVGGSLSVVVLAVAPGSGQAVAAYECKLFEHARERLVAQGIEVRDVARVVRVERDGLRVEDGGDGFVPGGLVVWTTGNANVPLLERLDARKKAAGAGFSRLLTDSRLRIRKAGDGGTDDDDGGDGGIWEDVYGLGDACDVEGAPLPTTAEVAVQKARYLASVLNSGSKAPYRFRPKLLAASVRGGNGIIQDGDWTGRLAWLSWRQGRLTWTRSLRAKSMIVLSWGLDRLFGSELARL